MAARLPITRTPPNRTCRAMPLLRIPVVVGITPAAGAAAHPIRLVAMVEATNDNTLSSTEP